VLALPCIDCGNTVEIDNTNIGPASAVALRTPLVAIDLACVEKRGLAVEQGAVPFVLVDGREFRGYFPGVFVRSENPLSAFIYRRDT
jgi:hypothetical protein